MFVVVVVTRQNKVVAMMVSTRDAIQPVGSCFDSGRGVWSSIRMDEMIDVVPATLRNSCIITLNKELRLGPAVRREPFERVSGRCDERHASCSSLVTHACRWSIGMKLEEEMRSNRFRRQHRGGVERVVVVVVAHRCAREGAD